MKIKRRFEMTKEATFDFEFVCSVCNSQLKSFVWSGDIIFVYPCERCLEEYWDGENEERIYGCLHPEKCGVCGVDNKWGSEKSECPIAEFERMVK